MLAIGVFFYIPGGLVMIEEKLGINSYLPEFLREASQQSLAGFGGGLAAAGGTLALGGRALNRGGQGLRAARGRFGNWNTNRVRRNVQRADARRIAKGGLLARTRTQEIEDNAKGENPTAANQIANLSPNETRRKRQIERKIQKNSKTGKTKNRQRYHSRTSQQRILDL